MRVIITDDALADAEEAAQWYDARREGLGDAFVEAVRATGRDIGETPLAYREIEPGVRRRRVLGYPYHVYYTVADDVVEVISIYHCHRDPRGWRQGRP